MIYEGTRRWMYHQYKLSISGQKSGVGYPTSRYAVNGMTQSLARELGPDHISEEYDSIPWVQEDSE